MFFLSYPRHNLPSPIPAVLLQVWPLSAPEHLCSYQLCIPQRDQSPLSTVRDSEPLCPIGSTPLSSFFSDSNFQLPAAEPGPLRHRHGRLTQQPHSLSSPKKPRSIQLCISFPDFYQMVRLCNTTMVKMGWTWYRKVRQNHCNKSMKTNPNDDERWCHPEAGPLFLTLPHSLNASPSKLQTPGSHSHPEPKSRHSA